MLAAYEWLLDGAAHLKLARRPGETPLEFGSRLRDAGGASELPVARITSLAEQAMYSPRSPGREQGADAVASTREVLRELRRKAGLRRTLAGALRPTGSRA